MNTNKKIIVIIVGIITLLLITIGTTFAYFTANIIGTEDTLTLTVTSRTEHIGIPTGSGDYVLGTGVYTSPTGGNKIHTYNLEIYFHDTGLDQNADQGKSFTAYVEISNSIITVPTCTLENCLVGKITAQGGGSITIEAKGDSIFNVVPTPLTSGVYATLDDYGTSYYYRGERDSLNNNLLFAGFQWKIVRINGDGSIRIIYNGTEAQFTSSANTMNTNGDNTRVGTSVFNLVNTDNKYVGYMYGNISATAEEAQTNTNDSIMKTYVDSWYQDNILNQGTSVTSRLADNIFCNDRSIAIGIGETITTTRYKPYIRHNINASNPTPTLICEQKNDRFTVNDINIGNGVN